MKFFKLVKATATVKWKKLRYGLQYDHNFPYTSAKRSRQDGTTKLPNRKFLIQWLDTHQYFIGLVREFEYLTLAMVDLDRFKDINDNYGHEVGTEFLVKVCQRLRGLLNRPGEFVARVGGDELMIALAGKVMRETDPAEESFIRLCQISTDLQADPIIVEDMNLPVRVSIGMMCWCDQPKKFKHFLDWPDVAMYMVKQDSKAGRTFNQVPIAKYRPEFKAAVQVRREIRRRLEAAVEAGGLSESYMPVVDLKTGLPIGFESRFYPEGDWPDNFDVGLAIKILAENSKLNDVLWHQLEVGCLNLRQWSQRYGRRLSLSFNVSTTQIQEGGVAAYLKDLVARYDLDPSQLIIEVTETDPIIDWHAFETEFELLAGIGFGLAMDDFPSENASIEWLLRLVWTNVKLDKVFSDRFTAYRDRSFIRGLIAAIHATGATVTAEWINDVTKEQTAIELACDYGQGSCYGYGNVRMSSDEVELYLDGVFSGP